MLGQPISLLSLLVAVSAWSTIEAKNVTAAKTFAIDPAGKARSSVVRSERQHSIAAGMEQHAAALGEMGNSMISEGGADAIGERVAAAFEPTPKHSHEASVVQSNSSHSSKAPAFPTVSVEGKIFLRQPPDHKGTYKTREWFCDACMLVAGNGRQGGDTKGCYTVADFVCAGGEQCLMSEKTCYFGRVEVPQGIQVTYYSGFSGDPETGGWDNACVGRKDRGLTSDPNFPEWKGVVPRSGEPVCGMKIELMSGYNCETVAGSNDWKGCGTKGYPPPDSHATARSSFLLAAAAVMLAFFRS